MISLAIGAMGLGGMAWAWQRLATCESYLVQAQRDIIELENRYRQREQALTELRGNAG